MTDAILKSDNVDNADNNAAAAIQAGFAALNTNLASVNACLQNLAAANGDILRALKSGAPASRGCGCCCGGCGGGWSSDNAIGCNIVYAVYDTHEENGIWKSGLVSYRNPLRSQAEADKVDVIVFLGSMDKTMSIPSGPEFTLDGFAMLGDLPINLQAVDSYPCSFLRKEDGSGWIPLTMRDIMHSEWSSVRMVDPYYILHPEERGAKYSMCCGLFEHNCRGKVFYAQILCTEIPDYWTEEAKQKSAIFYLRKNNIFYDKFPDHTTDDCAVEDDGNYIELGVAKDFHSWGSTWGELIEKFGNKPFGVRIAPDGWWGNVQGYAFAME